MFGWVRKQVERKARACAEAERLIQEHGTQARHVLKAHIRGVEATGQNTKELWRVMREVRKRTGSKGLDTATRLAEDR
jgi:hypothetical protein